MTYLKALGSSQMLQRVVFLFLLTEVRVGHGIGNLEVVLTGQQGCQAVDVRITGWKTLILRGHQGSQADTVTGARGSRGVRLSG